MSFFSKPLLIKRLGIVGANLNTVRVSLPFWMIEDLFTLLTSLARSDLGVILRRASKQIARTNGLGAYRVAGRSHPCLYSWHRLCDCSGDCCRGFVWAPEEGNGYGLTGVFALGQFVPPRVVIFMTLNSQTTRRLATLRDSEQCASSCIYCKLSTSASFLLALTFSIH